MAKTRRKYKGNATAATISAGLSAGAVSATISANTGWPTSGPFYCVVDPGTSAEEKILIGSISGTTISSITRGVDDTSDQNHASGCTIYPVFTAIDADEANELTATYTTRGDIVYHGASTFARLAVGSADQVLKTNGTDPSWGQVGTNGIATGAVTADKIATDAVGSDEIAANAVGVTEISTAIAGNGLSGGGGSALAVNVDDSTIEINSDTLRLKDGGVTSAKIANGAIVNEDINASAAIAYSKLSLSNSIVAGDLTSNAVTTAKITDANVTNAKLNNGSSGDIPLVTVSTSDPTGGKNGDIWVKVV